MSIPFPVRVAYFVLTGMLFIGSYLLLTPPMPQPLAYHNFADQRPYLGMPHMLNVASNLPLFVVGVWGMVFMASETSRRPGLFLQSAERCPYWIYFVGLVLTGVGSSYYHANPNNATLVVDRIGLAVTFMAFFTAVLTERLDWRFATWLLGPMVVLGVCSVLFWHWTETRGAGDLRFYLMVQFFPLVALPLLFLFFTPRYTRTGDLVASLACYGIAKVLEILDGHVYAHGGLVSGHTLKHLIAGLSAYLIYFMLQRRRPIETPSALEDLPVHDCASRKASVKPGLSRVRRHFD